jgi:NADPH2:quinone reductase
VGLAAVQVARCLGAEVTAVASSDQKLAAAASYGARNLVDHRRGPLREALRAALHDGASAVIDPVGGDLSEPALRSLRRGGRFVTVGFASGVIPRIPLNLVLVKGVTVRGFQFGDITPDEFERNECELTELLAAGRVPPHVGAVYALDDVVAALRLVADGRAVGKVVIDLT